VTDSPRKPRIGNRFASLDELRAHITKTDAAPVDQLMFSARTGTIDCKELVEIQASPISSLGFNGMKLLNLDCISVLDPKLLTIFDCRFGGAIPFAGMQRLNRLMITCVGKAELSELNKASTLRFLELRRYRLNAHEVSGVLGSDSAQKVTIHDGTFPDFASFRFPSATYLSLYRCKNVSSLNGIGLMNRLTGLELDFTVKTSNFDPLGELSELESLYIGGSTRIASLSFVSRLPKLTRLAIGGNASVVDGSLLPLKNHPKLEGAYMRFKRHYYPPAKEIPSWNTT